MRFEGKVGQGLRSKRRFLHGVTWLEVGLFHELDPLCGQWTSGGSHLIFREDSFVCRGWWPEWPIASFPVSASDVIGNPVIERFVDVATVVVSVLELVVRANIHVLNAVTSNLNGWVAKLSLVYNSINWSGSVRSGIPVEPRIVISYRPRCSCSHCKVSFSSSPRCLCNLLGCWICTVNFVSLVTEVVLMSMTVIEVRWFQIDNQWI